MLITCPECELKISDKAIVCPHCGYPVKPGTKQPCTRRKNKRRRLPNGFGQISEIKGRNLRKPFRAMVSVGKSENGRPIVKPLKPESYFETYNDAYAALAEYNKSPYDLDAGMTTEELFEQWYPEYLSTVARGSAQSIRRTWQFCSAVYKMRAKDIRPRHIKGCLENGVAEIGGKKRNPNTSDQIKIKSLFNLMLDYALEFEIVDKNYSRDFNLPDEVINDAKTDHIAHKIFKNTEIQRLWDHVYDVDFADVLLIQCYSGWRPQELARLRIKNINFEEGYMRGGMKTDAGGDRIVPIHPRIRDLLKRRYDLAKEQRYEELLGVYTYKRYSTRFNNLCKALEFEEGHRPHDGRKQFVTMAKKAGVDEYSLKLMIGHKISDITESIYTQRDLEWLRTEIEKIR